MPCHVQMYTLTGTESIFSEDTEISFPFEFSSHKSIIILGSSIDSASDIG